MAERSFQTVACEFGLGSRWQISCQSAVWLLCAKQRTATVCWRLQAKDFERETDAGHNNKPT